MNPEVPKMFNGKVMLLSKYAMCNSEKPRFTEEQEANGLLSKLGIRTTLSKVPLLNKILIFYCKNYYN